MFIIRTSGNIFSVCVWGGGGGGGGGGQMEPEKVNRLIPSECMLKLQLSPPFSVRKDLHKPPNTLSRHYLVCFICL